MVPDDFSPSGTARSADSGIRRGLTRMKRPGVILTVH
jgi:hypothetical protein